MCFANYFYQVSYRWGPASDFACEEAMRVALLGLGCNLFLGGLQFLGNSGQEEENFSGPKVYDLSLLGGSSHLVSRSYPWISRVNIHL